VVFTNSSTNANSYTWNLGDGSAPINTTTLGTQNGSYSNVGIYNVTLTAANDFCAVTDTIQVQVIPFTNAFIHIPNVFTPNGDGKNDLWSIPALSLRPESKVFIFDRFGRLLTEYPGTYSGWNGLIGIYPATAGDYWYVIQLKDNQVLKGNFSLIR
jgi:gliding motility-associated-like protein